MQELITELTKKGILKTPIIVGAFKNVDRKDFVTPEAKAYAYLDNALSIGFGQTISQPTTVAYMLELLSPKAGDNILDVGSGSGWTTALLAYITGINGKVTGLERIPELIEFGNKNMSKYNFKNTMIRKASDQLGYPDNAPYDKILVSAASQEIPQTLVDQLKINGIMVIPIKQSLHRITKVSAHKIKDEEIFGFIFVPLIY